jgi:hypothetical protein
MGPRRRRERRTIEAMIGLYCRDHHGEDSPLCEECAELFSYALARLERCPNGEEKPSCRRCLIHCYRPDMRERIRLVMRYAGPRMLLHKPLLAIRHMWDEVKSK